MSIPTITPNQLPVLASYDGLVVGNGTRLGRVDIDASALVDAEGNAIAAAASAQTALDAAALALAGSPYRLPTFTSLAARLRYSGATGNQINVTDGDVVDVPGVGAYLVRTSGTATDDEIILAAPSNVRLRVLPGANGYDVKAFGAVGDGVANDGAALQAALNATNSGRCSTVHISGGTYLYTTTLNVPQLASIEGCGQSSILRPNSCNGLNFLQSNVVGARTFRNFWIFANGGNGFAGIVVDLDSTIVQRVTGITFSDIYISFFSTAVSARGLWHSLFTNCYFLNVHSGIIFRGQSVKNAVVSCNISRGNPLVTGVGDTRGVVSEAFAGVRPEDVVVETTLIFGFDIQVDVKSALKMHVLACDLDFTQKIGIRVESADGGFSARDNWIALDNAAPNAGQRGIDFVNLGAVRRATAIVDGNDIRRTSGGAGSGDICIRIGSNQEAVVVTGNTTNNCETGIYNDGANFTRIQNNIVDGATSVFLFNCSGVVIENNHFSNAMYTHPTGVSDITYGKNTGVQTTKATGEITIGAGLTTVTVTLASLGFANVVKLAPSRHKVLLTFNNEGGLSRGAIWGSCDGANITVNVTTAFGSPIPVQFALQVY